MLELDHWRLITCWPIVDRMRLKTSIWVAAYLRRCQTAGVFGAVRRRGAEEAGAVFVKVALLDGLSDQLPDLVDQLTPEGRVPTEAEASRLV